MPCPPKISLRAVTGWLVFCATLPTLRGGLLDGWRNRMQSIVPRSYVCRPAATPIVIDGRPDDAAWAAAPWTADFVDIEGDAKPKPRFRTRAKLLWDDRYLYIAAELEEPHVWGTLTTHDTVIFNDPDFEVFLDPDGDTHGYYEFEMNALNTGWDLQLVKPYIDGGPARNEWEIPGLQTAVHVRGTINNPADKDLGWTLEIAMPWAALGPPPGRSGPPGEGERWRLNFSRVEWHVTTEDGVTRKVPKTPEDNWVWSPQGVVDMHRPEMWGVLQFTHRPSGEAVTVAPIPGKAARDAVLAVYYAQVDFRKAQGRWALTLDELGPVAGTLAPAPSVPTLRATSDGYECTARFADGAVQRTWRIRQDRWLRLE